MSLFKNADGTYEADFRFKDLPRLHLSMRTKKKTEAEPLYQAVRRLYREAKGPGRADRLALIEQLRTGALSIERLAAMVREGHALAPERPAAVTTWPTVDVAIERYLAWIAANPNRRHSTWRHAGFQLQKFAEFIYQGVRVGELYVDQVTSALLEAYQRSLVEEKLAVNTVTAYMSRVGTLWLWLQRRENRAAVEEKRHAIVLHSPLDPETTSRETTARDRWLTKDEAERLLAVTPDQLRVVVAMGLFGGFRIGEILHLRTYGDIDLDVGTITVGAKQVGNDRDGRPVLWRPKTTNSARVVPIADDLKPIIEAHLARYSSEQWLVPSIEDSARPFVYLTFYSHFTTIVKNAELEADAKDPRRVTFHVLRHTFASWLVMAGVDLYTVAQLLGDTLAMVERTYAHLAPDYKKRAIEALRGAIKLPSSSGIVEETATASATGEGQ